MCKDCQRYAAAAPRGSDYPGQTVACRHGAIGPCLYCQAAAHAEAHAATLAEAFDAMRYGRRPPVGVELEVADDYERPHSVRDAEPKTAPAQEAA